MPFSLLNVLKDCINRFISGKVLMKFTFSFVLLLNLFLLPKSFAIEFHQKNTVSSLFGIKNTRLKIQNFDRELTYEEIDSITQNIQNRISSIDKTQFNSREEIAQEILRLTKNIQNVKSVYWPKNAESITVQLSDGTPYIIFNRFLENTQFDLSHSIPAALTYSTINSISSNPIYNSVDFNLFSPNFGYNYVVLGKRALLMNAYNGDVFTKESENILKKILTDKGYDVDVAYGDLNSYRNVSGYDFFWTSGHGGVVNIEISSDPTSPESLMMYGLLTNHPAKDPSSLSLEERLYYRKLMSEMKITVGQADAKSPRFFVILPAFIKEHWKFNTPSSVAIIDHCSSATDELFLNSIKSTGVKRFFGWSAIAWSNKAGQIIRSLVDMSLGTNETSSLNPKSRPFNIEDVFVYMEANGLTIDDTKPHSTTEIQADLKFIPLDNGIEPVLMAPTIRQVNLYDNKKRAGIMGDFAPQAQDSTVLLNGQPLHVISWTKSNILVDFPFEGKDSYGKIQVIQNFHKSNSVPITQWKGQLKISTPIKTMGSQTNNFVVDCSFRFIEDFRGNRPSIQAGFNAPTQFNLSVIKNSSDTCQWQASGKIIKGDKTTEFGPNQGTFRIKDTTMQLTLNLTSSPGTFDFYIQIPAADVTYITKDSMGKITDQGTVQINPQFQSLTSNIPTNYDWNNFIGKIVHDQASAGADLNLNLKPTDLPDKDTEY